MSIGMADFVTREAEEVRLGISSTSDVCLARVNSGGFPNVVALAVKNKGRGAVTITLKKRGVETNVSAEDIEALRVGSTDRFRGSLAKRRIKPGTVVITDANAVVPQKIEDSNEDGILWQTDGPSGPTYPRQVGTINYNEGTIDFTFVQAVTLTTVEAAYTQTDWTAFGTPITFNLAAGGGERTLVIQPDNAQNYFASLRDEEEFGVFGKKTGSSEANTEVGLVLTYMGDDSPLILPIAKGEITGYPYHNQ